MCKILKVSNHWLISLRFSTKFVFFRAYLVNLVVFWYLYGGFDAWPINTEFLGDDRAIFRLGVFRSMAFHCKILNMPTERRGILSVVFTILQSERNLFLEKGLLSYMFQALIGELVVWNLKPRWAIQAPGSL
jgi:hypothetical protein